jgi:hypothetical protein
MILFMIELGADPMLELIARPRHLLPVIDEDGSVLCIGSRSRAQYLEGGFRDERAEYPLVGNAIPEMRAAHKRLIEKWSQL